MPPNLRKELRDCRCTCPNGNTPAHSALEIGHVQFEQVGLTQYSLCALQAHFASRGQLHPRSRALEKSNAQLGFKVDDAAAHRG